MQALDEGHPLNVAQLADRFGVEDVLQTVQDCTFMTSLLYYFGVLTLAGQNPFGELALRIPNLVVRRLYVEQLRDMLLPDLNRDEAVRAAEALYGTGDMQPLRLCRTALLSSSRQPRLSLGQRIDHQDRLSDPAVHG